MEKLKVAQRDLKVAQRDLKVGLIGCGAIGTIIAKAIAEDLSNRFSLVTIFDLLPEKAQMLCENLSHPPKISENFEDFLNRPMDLAIEAASQNAVQTYGIKILESGKDLMIMSIGVLLDDKLLNDLKSATERYQRRIYIPSGAIAGLDAIKASSLAGLNKVTLTTTKSPKGLKGAPYIKEKQIDLDSIIQPTLIYEGRAKEAVRFFPENVNVAASLSLAGIGKERTWVKIIVDPNISENIHEIKAEGKFGNLVCRTENLPCPENPKTSYLAALSAIKKLEEIGKGLVIGT